MFSQCDLGGLWWLVTAPWQVSQHVLYSTVNTTLNNKYPHLPFCQCFNSGILKTKWVNHISQDAFVCSSHFKVFCGRSWSINQHLHNGLSCVTLLQSMADTCLRAGGDHLLGTLSNIKQRVWQHTTIKRSWMDTRHLTKCLPIVYEPCCIQSLAEVYKLLQITPHSCTTCCLYCMQLTIIRGDSLWDYNEMGFFWKLTKILLLSLD